MYEFPIELYESPIELLDDDIFSNLKERRDDHIYATIQQSIGANIDKDELIKALQYDRGQYEKGCRDGVIEFAKYLKDHSFLCDSNDFVEGVFK